MNPSRERLVSFSFNQDNSCVSVGTRKGYKLYNCDPFGKIHGEQSGGYGIVAMLFCTSLVALVGLGEQIELSPRRLQIVNTKRASTICELTFPTSILAVKMNRKRLVAVLERQIYIYDISNMKLLHTIETLPNQAALCSLSSSSSSDPCFLALPSLSSSSSTTVPTNNTARAQHAPSTMTPVALSGHVLLYDASALQPINVIEAHRSPLAAIALNQDGTLLATASDKGTILRVFSVPGAQKLYQFRRGSLPARIHDLAFDLSSSFMLVSSDTETVHVFKLQTDQHHAHEQTNEGDGSGNAKAHANESAKKSTLGMIGRSFAGAVGAYLPSSVTEMWEPMRDFASVKVSASSSSSSAGREGREGREGGGSRSVVAMNPNAPQVMVLSSDGVFSTYSIDMEKGGECLPIKQYNLLDSSEELSATRD